MCLAGGWSAAWLILAGENHREKSTGRCDRLMISTVGQTGQHDWTSVCVAVVTVLLVCVLPVCSQCRNVACYSTFPIRTWSANTSICVHYMLFYELPCLCMSILIHVCVWFQIVSNGEINTGSFKTGECNNVSLRRNTLMWHRHEGKHCLML